MVAIVDILHRPDVLFSLLDKRQHGAGDDELPASSISKCRTVRCAGADQ